MHPTDERLHEAPTIHEKSGVAALHGLLQKKLLVVTGKGGVGRTTVAASLAHFASQQGKRVLFAQTKSVNQISSLFQAPGSFETIALIRPNLWGVYLTPEAALREYSTLVLHSSFLANQLLDRAPVQAFFRVIPGLSDYAMLGKVWHHTTERQQGKPRFDLIVVDAPATGHLLSMLQVPSVICNTLPDGPLRKPAQACWSLLTNPHECQCVLVTLPQELPVTETIQLGNQLQQLGFRSGVVVINQHTDSVWSRLPFSHWLGDFSTAPTESLTPLWQAAWDDYHEAIQQKLCLFPLQKGLSWPQILIPHIKDQTSILAPISFHLQTIHQASSTPLIPLPIDASSNPT